METASQTSKKRPRGMTILLILSFINACWNIISSLVMYLMTPLMKTAVESGQIEEIMEPYSALLGEEQQQLMANSMNMMAQIDPKYWLFLLVLFVGSLLGVIKMFKGDKRGLHFYAISQILMLIDASIFLYSNQPQSTFFSDLMMTTLFILIYYLYFKRMEMWHNLPQDPNLP